MRQCVVLLFASLLTLCEAKGTIETPVFVLKGRDLLLELHAGPPERVLFVDWKINKTVTLVRFEPTGEPNVLHNVSGGFEFPDKNFSVTLKNLQEADSGVYSAEAGTFKGNKPLAEYKVTVQGPVSPVELTVDRVDSNSSESCDLHVTCRTHNSHINSTFRRLDQNCSQEGREQSEVTASGASLQVYLLKNTIICNHSNQVHWTQDFNTAEHLCSSNTALPLQYGWMTAIILILLLVVAFVLLCYHRKRRINSRQIDIETNYQVLPEVKSAPPLNQNSTYSLLGHSAVSTQPESIYATVEKPDRSSNH
ncbi:SLAM family member 9-like isoform X2 [Pungitius pungitius]|uniref:SLAM family member 9-like isoform X2 n=1 Tax=Pungitius pungitius TaxID=134920 RepID=UPI002E10D056